MASYVDCGECPLISTGCENVCMKATRSQPIEKPNVQLSLKAESVEEVMPSAEKYPLDIQSVGDDTYIVMSRGHHDLEIFMAKALETYDNWFLGGPEHVWCKTVPTGDGSAYHFVEKGTRGAWPATYCHEYGKDYKRYNNIAD